MGMGMGSEGLEIKGESNPLIECDCLMDTCPNCNENPIDYSGDGDDFFPELDATDEMGGLSGGATKEFTMLMVFVSCLMIMGLYIIWTNPIELWIQIPVTFVLILSLYYQIMMFRLGLTTPTLIMNLTDRLWNETVYQTEKRGYEILFHQEEDDEGYDKLVIKKSNIPRYKKPYIKVLILLNMVLTPAWRFRDGYEWDDRIYDEDE